MKGLDLKIHLTKEKGFGGHNFDNLKPCHELTIYRGSTVLPDLVREKRPVRSMEDSEEEEEDDKRRGKKKKKRKRGGITLF